MGFVSKLKNVAKNAGKKVLKNVTSPEGILGTVAPQLGIANAAIKGMTGGQIDPLKIATGMGKDILKGNFKGADIVNSAGDIIENPKGAIKLGIGAYSSLQTDLKNENIDKIKNLMSSTDAMVANRARDRASHVAASQAISSVDLAQPNLVSQTFHSICKSLVSSYDISIPTAGLSTLTMATVPSDACVLSANWAAPASYDKYYEDLTDLVRWPLTQTPVSDASVIVTFMNGLLEKLDDDNAMIEFLTIFGYAGAEVTLPNIEGKSPLARACLQAITKELCFKYMSAWVKGAQQNETALDFYREIMSEWLGPEVTTSHPMFVDMISAAVISLKGFLIARYLLENKCPYMANVATTFYHIRYNEVKDNPYDLLQMARNMMLIAQINYSRVLSATYTAALQGVCAYHQYSYMILALVVKLLSDATMFNKMCMNNDQINLIASRLMHDDLKYVFELSNSEFAWIDTVGVEDLADMITTSQMLASGITVGDGEVTIEEIESSLDSIKAAVDTTTEIEFSALIAYRDRIESAKREVTSSFEEGDIEQLKYQTILSKIDSTLASINARL